MGDDRSVKVYFEWWKAAEKFDYFIAGLAIALVGYLGKDAGDGVLTYATLTELLSIVLFLASAITGLKRIEINHTLMRLNHQQLHFHESAGNLKSAALTANADGLLINKQSGDIYTPETAAMKGEKSKTKAAQANAYFHQIEKKSALYYKWRNRFLIGGLLLLITSRFAGLFMACFNLAIAI